MTLKEKLGILNLVFILIVFSFILYKCATSEKKPKSEVSRDVEYMTMCQKLIKQSANYPSTVDHKVFSTNVYHAPNGNVAVTAPFSVKNAFGVEMDHTARCIFPKDGKPEIVIE